MTLFQTFLMVIYGVTVMAVILGEFFAVIFACVIVPDSNAKGWERFLAVCVFLLSTTLGVWEVNHDCWFEQYKHLIGL